MAFIYELPPERMPWYARLDYDALVEIAEVRYVAPVANPDWRRVLGPRGWLPSIELWNTLRWADVAFQWFADAAAPALSARLLGKPLVLVAGGRDVTDRPDLDYGMAIDRRTRWMARTALRLAGRVLAVSDFTLAQTRHLAPTAAAERLYLGLDAARFTPGDPSLPRQPSVITVSRVGTDWVLKGLEVFVGAARELPDVQFRLLGPVLVQAAYDRLRSLAPENVEFLPGVPHEAVADQLRRSAVYAQLSLHESFCLALAEGMLCGCTPVAARAGALPEVGGDVACYAEPGDPKSAAAAIRRALAAPRGQEARDRIVNHFPAAARRLAIQAMAKELAVRRGELV